MIIMLLSAGVATFAVGWAYIMSGRLRPHWYAWPIAWLIMFGIYWLFIHVLIGGNP